MATTTYRGVTLLEINQAGQITLANAALENLSRGVSGHVSIDCAGAADVTLTDADENDEAKNAIITCTGLLTGSINLIVPNEARKYVVYNNTTGAFTLTVKTVSGTGIAVAQTETALLYSDGTNMMNAVSAGSMSITEGDITLADVTTNDVTSTKHGFAPKHPNDAGQALNGAGAYSVPTAGLQSFWVPGQAMTPSLTAGATAAQVETTTNKNNFFVMQFLDSGAAEYAEFQVAMPKKWDEGTLTYVVYWTVAATDTTDVQFWLQGVAAANDDTLDVAFGTAIAVVDTGLGTANDLHISPTSAAVTIAGSPAAEELVAFRCYRDSSGGSDTMAQTVSVIGLKIFYTTTASTDA